MNDQPRTLLISPFFDADLPSGGVLYSIDVAREWLHRGRRVAVICADRPRSLGDLETFASAGRLTLHPIAAAEQLRFTHHPHDHVRQATQRLIDDLQPEIIHVHNTHGVLSAIDAAIESPAPVVLTALDFGLLCFNFYLYDGTATPCAGPASPRKCAKCVTRTIGGPARWLGPMLPRTWTRRCWPRFVRLDQIKSAPELHAAMRRILRSVDAVIAPSPIMASKLHEYGAPASRINQIVYGVAPDKIVRPAKTPSESLRFAFLGGPEPVKGLRVLIDAVQPLPDGLPLEIHALGGPAVGEVINRASPRARRYVRHCPPLFGRALAERHAEIDAVLVPSLWHENSPFVVLESLANGTPIIASDQAGIRHLLIPDHTGWLIPPHSPAAWTRAFIDALQHPARIRRMANHACFTRTTCDFVNDVEQLEGSLPQVRPLAKPTMTRCACTSL